MKLLFKIGWRNVWRNSRRSLITIAAIFFACVMSSGMRGLQEGTYDANIVTAVELFTGYLQIQREGFQENPTLRKAFKLNLPIVAALRSNEKIKGYAPRIMANGLVGTGDNAVGGLLFGVNPEMEKNVSKLMTRVTEGEGLTNERVYDIVVGYKMLGNLDSEIGDTVVILTQGFDGSTGNLKFRIAGTAKTGQPQFDAMAVFMNIKAADELMSMYGKINALAISLESMDALPEVQALIQKELDGFNANNDKKLVVLDWQELMPEIKQSIELDRVSGIIYLGILVLIVASGILNTVLMSITERFKEFGVMLALGTKNSFLFFSVFIETMFLALIGIFFGTLASLGINGYIKANPIELTGEMTKMYEEFGFIPELHSSTDPAIFINTALMIFIVSFVMFLLPGIRLFKLEALKGIRYT